MVGSSFLQSRNLLAMVHPTLRRLMEESGETVNLAVLDTSEYQAIIIDQVQCTALMRMSAPIGGKLPMHASGAGKAFLATLPDDQVTKLLHKKGMHTYTPHTLTPHNLKEGLAQIRKQGFSFDDEEHALGLRCVAACIFDEHREAFAAISISGPVSRITDDRVIELGGAGDPRGERDQPGLRRRALIPPLRGAPLRALSPDSLLCCQHVTGYRHPV